MKKLILILSFVALLTGLYSCDCACNGNDYDADDYRVTIVEKWTDIGKVSGYDAVETKYHMTITYTNISDSTYDVKVRKMLEVDGNIYHTYEQGKTYIFKPDKYNDYIFGLGRSYKKIVEEKESEARKVEEERNKLNRRRI